MYEKIYIVGFSTGGLLALLSAKKNLPTLKGIICINAALQLNDVRIKTFIPAINFWNDLVESFNSETYQKSMSKTKLKILRLITINTILNPLINSICL